MNKKQTNSKVEQEVEALIKETLKKNKKELDMALIRPLHPSYPFSTNGVVFLIGKMGSGKSFWIWKHNCLRIRTTPKFYFVLLQEKWTRLLRL